MRTVKTPRIASGPASAAPLRGSAVKRSTLPLLTSSGLAPWWRRISVTRACPRLSKVREMKTKTPAELRGSDGLRRHVAKVARRRRRCCPVTRTERPRHRHEHQERRKSKRFGRSRLFTDRALGAFSACVRIDGTQGPHGPTWTNVRRAAMNEHAGRPWRYSRGKRRRRPRGFAPGVPVEAAAEGQPLAPSRASARDEPSHV